MSVRDFLVLTIGIGQLRPEASNSLSKCMRVSFLAQLGRGSFVAMRYPAGVLLRRQPAT